MKLIILTSLVCLTHVLFSQKNVHPVVGISHTISIGESYYNNSILSTGVRLNMKTGYFDLKGAYQFSSGGILHSHQLGIDVEYRILSAQKRLSPFIGINGFSEIGTNYRDRYLNSTTLNASKSPESYTTNNYSSGYTISSYQTNFSNFYHATPFVGGVSAGLDVCLADGLHLNFSLGFGMRIVQTRYYAWGSGKEVNTDELHSKKIKNHYLKMFNTTFGLNYTIYKRDKETSKSRMLLGLQHTTSLGQNLYLNTGAFIGVSLDKAILKLGYQFSGTHLYTVQSHQIGAGLEYTFLSPEKRFRPYIELNGYTEVSSNYKNQYLDNNKTPVDGPSYYGMSENSNGLMVMSYKSSFYNSTPFAGNILAGLNIRLVDNLHLNVACGLGFRTIKTAYHVWRENTEITEEIIEASNNRSNIITTFDVKVGLNYFLTKRNK